MDEVGGSIPLSSTSGARIPNAEKPTWAQALVQDCPSAVGARAELEVAYALAHAGWDVYIPFFAPHSRVDLVIDRGERPKKVQCKTARLVKDVVSFATCSNTSGVRQDYRHDVDVFGVYSPELDQAYLVPVEDTASRGCYLRLTPARNGQKRRVRFASDYLVGPGGASRRAASREPRPATALTDRDYP